MATLSTKILVEADPPRSCRIILIFKKHDTKDPTDYRPISLSSCIGTVLHSISNIRLLRFLMKNKITGSSTQKGFTEAMNRCGQDTLKLQTIINNHCKARKSLHEAWLDITNACGSLRHDNLKISLDRYEVPARITITYYCYPCTFVLTNDFWTNRIKISVGIPKCAWSWNHLNFTPYDCPAERQLITNSLLVKMCSQLIRHPPSSFWGQRSFHGTKKEIPHTCCFRKHAEPTRLGKHQRCI